MDHIEALHHPRDDNSWEKFKPGGSGEGHKPGGSSSGGLKPGRSGEGFSAGNSGAGSSARGLEIASSEGLKAASHGGSGRMGLTGASIDLQNGAPNADMTRNARPSVSSLIGSRFRLAVPSLIKQAMGRRSVAHRIGVPNTPSSKVIFGDSISFPFFSLSSGRFFHDHLPTELLFSFFLFSPCYLGWK